MKNKKITLAAAILTTQIGISQINTPSGVIQGNSGASTNVGIGTTSGVIPKANGVTITLPGLTNTDPDLFVATAILTQGANVVTKVINDTLISTNSVTFSSSDLSAFNAQSFSIIILLQNYKYVKIGGQNFAFLTSNYYKKESYLY